MPKIPQKLPAQSRILTPLYLFLFFYTNQQSGYRDTHRYICECAQTKAMAPLGSSSRLMRDPDPCADRSAGANLLSFVLFVFRARQTGNPCVRGFSHRVYQWCAYGIRKVGEIRPASVASCGENFSSEMTN